MRGAFPQFYIFVFALCVVRNSGTRLCYALYNSRWKISELEEWLAFMHHEPEMTDEIKAFIDKEKKELSGEFCRGCGYCMPCTVGIKINNCARMSLMLRRAPSKEWLTTEWREEMAKIEDCVECGLCASRCPYELDTPQFLRRNLADYRKVLAGEAEV